jgi:hypothetical protein
MPWTQPTLRDQGCALAKMQRHVIDARPSRVGGMNPLVVQRVGVHEKPVEENLDPPFHRRSCPAV